MLGTVMQIEKEPYMENQDLILGRDHNPNLNRSQSLKVRSRSSPHHHNRLGLTVDIPNNVDVQNNNSNVATSPNVSKPTSPLRFVGQLLHLGNRPQNNIVMNVERLLRRGSLPAFRKKSDASKIPALKALTKKSTTPKSPNLAKKRQTSPDNGVPTSKTNLTTLSVTAPSDEMVHRSTEDLESEEVSSRDNGSSGDGALDECDGQTEGTVSDVERTKHAKEVLQAKINKTMDNIKAEQAVKEEHVNEYLRLASNADKQQLQRIKTIFEKKNQKSTQTISVLTKKVENYHKRMNDLDTYGFTGHKQARERLRDLGQGFKGVGANIVDGITGFSGGVVGNIKGAKDHIKSKPGQLAHMIKNKFGSADNINQLKTSIEDTSIPEGEIKNQTSTLPASFKFSDDDNSSVTSGSVGLYHNSPQSASQHTSQQLPVIQQSINMEPILQELQKSNEANKAIQESVQQLSDDFETYKITAQSDIAMLKTLLEEERYRVERLEVQINDMTELQQHEIQNLRQDITGMEEKTEYRLDERTSDIHDMLENCTTRITKMELQQQQQQIISMEMVENVTFRTLLTKLLNVVLAILAVILVFVSTLANCLAPFIANRTRVLSTTVLIVSVVMMFRNWEGISNLIGSIFNFLSSLFPQR
ncbi:transmembrane and coiled-coil domains protein 1-like isoform X2 [Mytilus californianus]|uniref:transmembrane and coiled-coil domains protein 1-like isoform X2 n=1 Tax=Mytilus californianus TaxID=6549 RepID=UPI0022452AF0|nr:transmembrane and coiled-coil domains protein 1-like isoform X2 [Mytilus californianus]